MSVSGILASLCLAHVAKPFMHDHRVWLFVVNCKKDDGGW